MAELFASGHIIDLIIVASLAEGLLLWSLRRGGGRGPGLRELGPTLASGLFLLLALRATSAGLPWIWTALALTLALLAHLLDLTRRWQRR
ncbi:MAG: hypothetical protein EA400_02915 [Chromatiaceae bacterium]|nr:MAG: hypothetical protein EA400_02915 [Chromatiaceae bacterium]